MHHRPVGPPLSARLSAAMTRGLMLARRSGGGRGAAVAVLCAVVTSLVLAVPVLTGGHGPSPEVSLGASSSSSASREPESPVVMGLDGGATSSAFAGASTAAPRREPPTTGPGPTAPGTTAPGTTAPGTTAPGTTAPGTTGAAPAAPPTTKAPAVVPEQGSASTERTENPAPRVAAAAPAAPDPSTAAPPAATPDREGEVQALVNAARADAGCDPLVADAGLAGVAAAHSADMRDRDFFDHVNPDGLDPFDRAEEAGLTNARAENIAYGQATAAAVMADWMDSRKHRENILDCELRTLGVGVADGPDGPWWTQLFGD